MFASVNAVTEWDKNIPLLDIYTQFPERAEEPFVQFQK